MPFHMYFKLCYHSCVKSEYQWQYQQELTEYRNLSKEAKKIHKALLSSVNVHQKVGLKFWEETPAFWDEVAQAVTKHYEQELKEWEQNLEVPKSAESFHRYVSCIRNKMKQ